MFKQIYWVSTAYYPAINFFFIQWHSMTFNDIAQFWTKVEVPYELYILQLRQSSSNQSCHVRMVSYRVNKLFQSDLTSFPMIQFCATLLFKRITKPLSEGLAKIHPHVGSSFRGPHICFQGSRGGKANRNRQVCVSRTNKLEPLRERSVNN